MTKPRHPLTAVATAVAVLAAAGLFAACETPPPKIAAIPASGLSLRLFVFGADAQAAHKRFEAIKKNNPSFSLVNAGGDAEVVVGLENDSGTCVEPTAACSYRVVCRVRDGGGKPLAETSTRVVATSSSCSG